MYREFQNVDLNVNGIIDRRTYDAELNLEHWHAKFRAFKNMNTVRTRICLNSHE